VGTLPRVTPEQHDDPDFAPLPRYWVPEFDVDSGKRDKKLNPIMWPGVATRLQEREWWHGWLMVWRDIARSTDTRTLIGSVLPAYGVGDKFLLALAPQAPAVLLAIFDSFVFDYVTRQKASGTALKYFTMRQLPAVTPHELGQLSGLLGGDAMAWIVLRSLELSYTSKDMAAFAQHHGDEGSPYHWDGERREALRAELDAALFHVYGLQRDDVEYVMGTFPTVEKRDESLHGTYRTRDLILDVYDRMEDARVTGGAYQTLLDPPPGKGPRHDS
jgi:hypothetical protein